MLGSSELCLGEHGTAPNSGCSQQRTAVPKLYIGWPVCSLASVFGSMLAPGHASGVPMFAKGGLDPFWGCLELKWLPRGSMLRVLGSAWAPFWLPFEGPRAPGHTSGGFLCPRGGLDRFLKDFGSQIGSQKGAKLHLKINEKSMKFGMRFLMKFGAPNGANMEPWSFPKSTKI